MGIFRVVKEFRLWLQDKFRDTRGLWFGAGYRLTGSVTVNVVRPGRESTLMLPPWR